MRNLFLIDYLLYFLPNRTVSPVLPHRLFDFDQVVLLGTQNGSWPCDSNPPNKFSGRETIVLHCIACNQSTCSPQPRLTVDCKSTVCFLGNLKEFINDLHWWDTSISKIKFVMVNTVFNKLVGVICFIIESYDWLDSQLLKDGSIIMWSKRPILA